MRSRHYYPSFNPHAAFSALRAFEGINSCWVPIYYTWVERDNCGQNALSKGVRTEWDSNPRPDDCKSRARTTTPQCSHYHLGISMLGYLYLSWIGRFYIDWVQLNASDYSMYSCKPIKIKNIFSEAILSKPMVKIALVNRMLHVCISWYFTIAIPFDVSF